MRRWTMKPRRFRRREINTLTREQQADTLAAEIGRGYGISHAPFCPSQCPLLVVYGAACETRR